MKKIISIILSLITLISIFTACGSEPNKVEETSTQETVNYNRELADEIKNETISNIEKPYYSDDISVTVREKTEITEIDIYINYGNSPWQVWECFKAISPFMEKFEGKYLLTVCVMINPNDTSNMVKFDTTDLKTGTLISDYEVKVYKPNTSVAELYEYCNWRTIGEHTDEIPDLG